ncbi:MAG: YDG domain-containing protein [Candidatus Pedobacter colombiensis]|uniref:YDG domain-containing protein n=1 Tax=Candidatus Pedobacter colombiensis TaxID=3121371 RepID=A0AAJ6B6R0_9SPHI|nr:YDG domain-containing protein [Pedobacter sp.]WEK19114.1 MAG: YDG domain-containing protein [Pedobacter sp.]
MNKLLLCTFFLVLLGLTPMHLFAQPANQNFESLNYGNYPGTTDNVTIGILKYSVVSPTSRTYQTLNGTPQAFLSVQTPGGNNGAGLFSGVSKMLVLNQNYSGYEGGTFTLSPDGESNYSTGAADLRIATIDGSKFKINSMYIDPGRTNEHPYSEWYSVDVKGYKNGVEVAKITISDFTKTGNRNYGSGANVASYTAVDKGSLTTYGGLLVFIGSNWANIDEIRFTSTGPVAMAIDDLDFSAAGTTAVVPTLTTISAATNVSAVKATMGGTVINNGNATVIERGIIWNVNAGSLVLGQGNKVIMGSGTGSFSDVVGSLPSGSIIRFRSYAINSAGVGYGETRGFTTTAAMSATFDLYHISCPGTSTGAASINIIGGKGPYTYSWSGSSDTGPTVFGLKAGSQTCTVTDGEGSTITETFVINEPVPFNAIYNQGNAICNGGNDGWAEIVPDNNGPYTYSWMPGGATTAKISNLIAGTYVCTITNSGGCSITRTVIITEPKRVALVGGAFLAGNIGSLYSRSVFGANGGNGTYSYAQVSGTLPPGLTLSPTGQLTGTPTSLGTYNFSVEVKTSNCPETATADFSLIIYKASQTIVFNTIPAKSYGDVDFVLGNTSTAQSLPITYTAADPSIVSIVGNIAHILKVGTTQITASQAGNDYYNAATSVSRALTVSTKTISASGYTVSKVYDGTNTATITLNATGKVGTDDVGISYTSAVYANKNVGTGKQITYTGLALTGADKSNYFLGTPVITGVIIAKDITGNFTADDKVYDGLTSTTILTRTIVPLPVDDGNLTLIGGVATFADANAGIGKAVTATGMTLSGTAAGNYRLISISPAVANITARDITGSFVSSNKVYDGLLSASITSRTVTPLAADAGKLTLTGGLADFADANVGVGKTITATGMTLDGTAAGNYNLISVSPATANITALDIIGSFSSEDKVYDGVTAASITNRTIIPLATDAGKLTLTGGSANFANANAGTGKTVTATGMVLGGSAAGNYNLISVSPSIANITAKEITGSFVSEDKVYDGLSSASIISRTITPLAADAGNLTLTGGVASFADANAGIGKAVTASGMTLGGSAAGNYNLIAVSPAVANIMPKNITGSFTASSKIYDGLTLAVIIDRTITSLVADAGNLTLTGGVASFADANAGIGKTVTATGMTLGGAAAGNYNLVSVLPTTANITALDITGSFTSANKVYDGLTSAVITNRTITPLVVDAGKLTLTGGVASFADANAGIGKAVTATGMTLSGAVAGNYHLISVLPTTANITPKDITGSFGASNKVYDGLTSAMIADRSVTPLTTDAGKLTLTGGFANFSDANVGTGKTVTATGMVLSGSAAGNYNLVSISTAVANISTKPVIVTVNANQNKIYGAVNPDLNYTITPGGLLGTDVLSGNLARASGENVGFYAINKGSLVAGANYALQFVGNSFEIKQANLTIIGDSKEKFVGTENPPLTISYRGFVNNEGVAALNALPYIGTTATLNSGMGSYPIMVGGASAINYSISYQNGVLQVKPGAPTSVSLAAIVVFENRPAGTKVGDLSSTSQDPNATFTYSFATGAGDIDNSKFQIVGKELRTSQSLDYEEKSSYSIRVRSTTQYGFTLDQIFIVQIEDVNEQPTLNPIADQRIYFQTGKEERIGLENVSPGPELHQTVTASIQTDRASLFDRLEVINNQVIYKIKPGQLGEANITVTITDNGGTANGGVDKISRSFNLKVDATPVITGTGTQVGLKIPTDYISSPGIGKGLSSQLRVQAEDVVSYRWTGIGLSNANISNPVAQPLTTMTYQVTITNSKGYSITLPITVEVREDYIIEAENNFSPNGDGINDTWVIKNIENYPNHVVTIFDRAGRVLYTVNGYKNTWDGTVNGAPLAEGTYYYMIKFTDQKVRVIKGFITIVR